MLVVYFAESALSVVITRLFAPKRNYTLCGQLAPCGYALRDHRHVGLESLAKMTCFQNEIAHLAHILRE